MEWLFQPVKALDQTAIDAAEQHQLVLTKPTGAMGELEKLAIRLAGMQGCGKPTLDRVRSVVFAADQGVAAEGVSAYPQSVTAQMIDNLVSCGAASSVLARAQNVEFKVIDLGTVAPCQLTDSEHYEAQHIAPQSGNLRRTVAMTSQQLEQAMQAGVTVAEEAKAANVQLMIAGEMGIANTTPAAALTCALTGLSAIQLTGRGTGIDDAQLAHKRQVIEDALELHKDAETPVQWLAAVGGFDIAAMAGLYLRCAQLGIPVLLDGFISCAAALVAVRIQPAVRQWMLFSHCSAEQGHRVLLEQLEGKSLIDLGMRLGEGSGALVALPLLRNACVLHNDMATFDQAGVDNKPA